VPLIQTEKGFNLNYFSRISPNAAGRVVAHMRNNSYSDMSLSAAGRVVLYFDSYRDLEYHDDLVLVRFSASRWYIDPDRISRFDKLIKMNKSGSSYICR